MSPSARPSVLLYSCGSDALPDLRRALEEAGVETLVVSSREEVTAVPPRAIVFDLQGFPDPWNDVRRFGADARLAGTGIFLYAEGPENGVPQDRAGKIARFARLVAEALGIPRRP